MGYCHGFLFDPSDPCQPGLWFTGMLWGARLCDSVWIQLAFVTLVNQCMVLTLECLGAWLGIFHLLLAWFTHQAGGHQDSLIPCSFCCSYIVYLIASHLCECVNVCDSLSLSPFSLPQLSPSTHSSISKLNGCWQRSSLTRASWTSWINSSPPSGLVYQGLLGRASLLSLSPLERCSLASTSRWQCW